MKEMDVKTSSKTNISDTCALSAKDCDYEMDYTTLIVMSCDKDEIIVNGTFVVVVSREDIDNIMISALEGGINYWCDSVIVRDKHLGDWASEQISRGGELELYDAENEDSFVLTKSLFVKGLTDYLEHRAGNVVFQRHGNVFRIDTGCIDGAAADAIIQYALFNDIVYG